MTALVVFDTNQHESYEDALKHGAVHKTPSCIDALDESNCSGNGVIDVLEILQTAMSCIGYDMNSLEGGVVVDGEFIKLVDYYDSFQ